MCGMQATTASVTPLEVLTESIDSILTKTAQCPQPIEHRSVLTPFMSSNGSSNLSLHEATRSDPLSPFSSSPVLETPPNPKKKKATIIIQCEAASTPLVIIRAPETNKLDLVENKTVFGARSKNYEEDTLNDDESSLYEYDGGSDSSASSSSSDYLPVAKHRTTSGRPRRRACPKCRQKFLRRDAYKKHLVRVHGLLPICCEEEGCKERFSTLSELFKHRKTHDPSCRFPCMSCRRVFTSVHARAVHARTHFRRRSVVCDDCGMIFKQLSHLQNHLRRVHRRTVRPKSHLSRAPPQLQPPKEDDNHQNSIDFHINPGRFRAIMPKPAQPNQPAKKLPIARNSSSRPANTPSTRTVTSCAAPEPVTSAVLSSDGVKLTASTDLPVTLPAASQSVEQTRPFQPLPATGGLPILFMAPVFPSTVVDDTFPSLPSTLFTLSGPSVSYPTWSLAANGDQSFPQLVALPHIVPSVASGDLQQSCLVYSLPTAASLQPDPTIFFQAPERFNLTTNPVSTAPSTETVVYAVADLLEDGHSYCMGADNDANSGVDHDIYHQRFDAPTIAPDASEGGVAETNMEYTSTSLPDPSQYSVAASFPPMEIVDLDTSINADDQVLPAIDTAKQDFTCVLSESVPFDCSWPSFTYSAPLIYATDAAYNVSSQQTMGPFTFESPLQTSFEEEIASAPPPPPLVNGSSYTTADTQQLA
uniref:Zinc finger protein 764 n=2 Tax=Schistocephalus solidus TaxID=70667 RepID=A0A0X3NQT9_SCHSO